jgi:ferredoxin-NADP reductase
VSHHPALDSISTEGSTYSADTISPGTTIEIGAPCNSSPLEEDAPRTVYITGGIGITPFLPMMALFNESGRSWPVPYGARIRDRATLLGEIEAFAVAGVGEISFNVDQEPDGVFLNVDVVIGGLGPDKHVYCWGPVGMLDAFKITCRTAGVADGCVHFEDFTSNIQAAAAGGYEVVLAKTGKLIQIQEERWILGALLAVDVDVAFLRREGDCGACETRVLAGELRHRDLILTDQECASGLAMTSRCSGAKSATLTFDI